jgi:cellulose synthase/poly-beta-1,6-N-acetylglucosamine synthase-like glycosyltransferase
MANQIALSLPTLFFITTLFSILYIFIIFKYIKDWDKLSVWHIPPFFAPSTKISVLIPARNEADGIESCLDSILQNNYPKNLYEIIAIDDHSEDTTPQIIQQKALSHSNLHLLELKKYIQPNETQSFKKKAIETAIAQATGDLIVTTDADCMVQPNWLLLLASYYEKNNYKFIAAPVNFYRETNALTRFQSLDFMGMMGVTGGGIAGKWNYLCNGANLAYQKAAFYAVGGFSGIDNLASGDDILLLHKMVARYPESVGFLKNKAATVFTEAKPTLQSFISQRLRWATKNSGYTDFRVTATLGVVFLYSWLIVVFLVGGVWNVAFFWASIGLLACKFGADAVFLYKMSDFFERKELMKGYLSAALLHLLYILGIGTASLFIKKYEWKGRKVI